MHEPCVTRKHVSVSLDKNELSIWQKLEKDKASADTKQ
jgi:hypothetical protein